MSRIIIKNLTKKFGDFVAVKNLNLTIKSGDFLTLLGPSGCGKTTTLRCISGLEKPNEGEISVDDEFIFSEKEKINFPPGDRGLGLVFQNYALWPHMTVNENIGFGLRHMKLSKDEKLNKVVMSLKAMGLEKLGERYPHELSGGQQQRVAVARMIVTEPKILLFDEPLSNLDAKLRMRLRSELKRLHINLKATSVYVTHDQVEALSLSTKIVVMKDGVIQQLGTPDEVYHYPANVFVADFMGNPQTNIVKATAVKGKAGIELHVDELEGLIIKPDKLKKVKEGDKLIINIRPEDVDFEITKNNNFSVYTTLPMGSEILSHIKSKTNDFEMVIKGPEETFKDLDIDKEITLKVKRGNIYDVKTENLIESFGF